MHKDAAAPVDGRGPRPYDGAGLGGGIMSKSNDDRFRGFNFARVNLFLLGFIALLLAGAALKLTSDVVLPFVVAVLLTFVLEPFIIALERIKIPRSLGTMRYNVAQVLGGIY